MRTDVLPFVYGSFVPRNHQRLRGTVYVDLRVRTLLHAAKSIRMLSSIDAMREALELHAQRSHQRLREASVWAHVFILRRNACGIRTSCPTQPSAPANMRRSGFTRQ